MEVLSKDTDIFTGEKMQPEFDNEKLDFLKLLIMQFVEQIKRINQITITFNHKTGE